MLGDITWQDFQAHDRTALDAAVAYEAVYYTQETPINTALTACAAARVADFEGNHNFLVSRA